MQGLLYRIDTGHLLIDIEIDSLILVKVLKEEIDIPWGIVYEVREMWKCLEMLNFSLAHTYRENNMGADCLANIGCSSKCRWFVLENCLML